MVDTFRDRDLRARAELNDFIARFNDPAKRPGLRQELAEWREAHQAYLDTGDMTKDVRKALNSVETQLINAQYANSINFIDVGAFGWLPEPWGTSRSTINYLVRFEPFDEPSSDKGQITFDCGVWEADEIRPLYITRGHGESPGASLFKRNHDYVERNFETLKHRGPRQLAESWFERSELVETKDIQCRSIDSLMSNELAGCEFHFMKCDTQGAEYNILKGANAFLNGSCVGLHLELFQVPMYEGIAAKDEVVDYLRSFGFELVKEFPPLGTFHCAQDCLFLNEDRDPDIRDAIRNIYRL